MASPVKRMKLGPTRGRPIVSDSAKKRRKSITNKNIGRSRINIGSQISRWNTLKSSLGETSNVEMAKKLLDRYEERQKKTSSTSSEIVDVDISLPSVPGPSGVVTSTPAPGFLKPMATGIESESDSLTGQSSISGIHPISSSEQDEPKKQEHIRSVRQQTVLTSSFIDPFEVSIDVFDDSEAEVDSEDDSDVDYEPSLDICIGPVGADIEELSFAEENFGREEEGDKEDDETEDTTPSTGVHRLHVLDEAVNFLEQEVSLCYRDCLLQLANSNIESTCKTDGCQRQVSIKTSCVGTALYFTWICPSGHVAWRWCSQPVLKRGLHAGDLLTSAAILFSGNNYQKLHLMAEYLNMPFVSHNSYLRIQRCYLVPSIEEYWGINQERLLATKHDQDVVILGDGRMDSPGHCAQYCTYTAMDNNTKEILSVVTIDKREVGKSSIRMEKEAFLRTLSGLDEKGVRVCEVVTDAHTSIAAHMRKEMPNIKHSFDVWHAAKNLAKKIMKASQQRQCGDLKAWCKHIVNHFYHTCDVAETEEEFLGVWFGLLHHTTDEHEWLVDYGGQVQECVHGPLTEPREISWLKKADPAHEALKTIVRDRRFQNNIPHFLNARSTAELEGFNNLILMYAGKRFAYTPPVYRARNLLAAIDHNAHLDREPLMNKDGTARLHKIYNKKSNRWALRQEKQKKTYAYKQELLQCVLRQRLMDRAGMFGKAVLKETDPRRLSSTIAPIQAPSKDILIEEQKSRFSKN